MPLFFQDNPATGIRLGLWRVSETADELLEQLPFSLKEEGLRDPVPNMQLFRQRLASRILLARMLKTDPVVLEKAMDGRRTVLANPKWQLSISHAGEYAAVMLSPHSRVGVDIEQVAPRISNISSRFVNEEEWSCLSGTDDHNGLMLLWAVKEAVFKFADTPGLDFKSEICCKPFKPMQEGMLEVGLKDQMHKVHYRFIGNYVLAWIWDLTSPSLTVHPGS